jgi:imidazolonepropionase-like amidohydrolase
MTGIDATPGPDLKYIEKSIRDKWPTPETPTDKSQAAAQYDFVFRLTGDMAKAGVPILAGTDTGDPYTVPGFELHKELALLVKAGLTPAAALRAATTEPARLMHREHELGEVKPGYDADLVILNADPLTDIANTRRIESVVLRGRVFDRAELNGMLARTAAASAKQ